MSIPTPARTPAQSQTRSHGTPVPPGTAGLWIAPAVWKTRTIRSRLNAPTPRRVFHTALDGPERRPYAPQALSFVLSNTTSRVESQAPVAKPLGGN